MVQSQLCPLPSERDRFSFTKTIRFPSIMPTNQNLQIFLTSGNKINKDVDVNPTPPKLV